MGSETQVYFRPQSLTAVKSAYWVALWRHTTLWKYNWYQIGQDSNLSISTRGTWYTELNQHHFCIYLIGMTRRLDRLGTDQPGGQQLPAVAVSHSLVPDLSRVCGLASTLLAYTLSVAAVFMTKGLKQEMNFVFTIACSTAITISVSVTYHNIFMWDYVIENVCHIQDIS